MVNDNTIRNLRFNKTIFNVYDFQRFQKLVGSRKKDQIQILFKNKRKFPYYTTTKFRYKPDYNEIKIDNRLSTANQYYWLCNVPYPEDYELRPVYEYDNYLTFYYTGQEYLNIEFTLNFYNPYSSNTLYYYDFSTNQFNYNFSLINGSNFNVQSSSYIVLEPNTQYVISIVGNISGTLPGISLSMYTTMPVYVNTINYDKVSLMQFSSVCPQAFAVDDLHYVEIRSLSDLATLVECELYPIQYKNLAQIFSFVHVLNNFYDAKTYQTVSNAILSELFSVDYYPVTALEINRSFTNCLPLNNSTYYVSSITASYNPTTSNLIIEKIVSINPNAPQSLTSSGPVTPPTIIIPQKQPKTPPYYIVYTPKELPTSGSCFLGGF